MKQLIVVFICTFCFTSISQTNPFKKYTVGTLYGLAGHQFARFTDKTSQSPTAHGTFSGAILSTLASGMSTSLVPNKTTLLRNLRSATVAYIAFRTMDCMHLKNPNE